MCDHRLWDLADGILCCRTDEHETHEYHGMSGPASCKHEDDGGDS